MKRLRERCIACGCDGHWGGRGTPALVLPPSFDRAWPPQLPYTPTLAPVHTHDQLLPLPDPLSLHTHTPLPCIPLNRPVAPVHTPSPCQDSGRIQASGEAVYGDDVPVVSGALHAAYVSSTHPSAQLLGVDWTPALTVPGETEEGWGGVLCL